MIKRTFGTMLLLAIICQSLKILGQTKAIECERIREGHFFYYSKKTNNWSEIFRQGTKHVEVELDTNDTSIYEVRWLTPCSCTLNFVGTSSLLDPGQEIFNKSFLTTIEILRITDRYYTFAASVSSTRYSQHSNFADTVWFEKR